MQEIDLQKFNCKMRDWEFGGYKGERKVIPPKMGIIRKECRGRFLESLQELQIAVDVSVNPGNSLPSRNLTFS
jgi:hypothetical protein